MQGSNTLIKFVILSLILGTMGFSQPHRRFVEIGFDHLSQLQQLVEMGVDLDHHRTGTDVHASHAVG